MSGDEITRKIALIQKAQDTCTCPRKRESCLVLKDLSARLKDTLDSPETGAAFDLSLTQAQVAALCGGVCPCIEPLIDILDHLPVSEEAGAKLPKRR